MTTIDELLADYARLRQRTLKEERTMESRTQDQIEGAQHTSRCEEIERMRAAVALAYGYLWHVNNEPLAPIPTYSPERAAAAARLALRDLLTHEQRGAAINKVKGLLGHNRR